jgi:hypothetical protein
MRADRIRGRAWLAAGVVVGLVALVVVAFVLAMPAPSTPPPKIDRDSAVTVARDFFGSAYGTSAKVTDVVVDDATLGTGASGRAAWRVTVHGSVVAGGGTASTGMVLDVDAQTGAITVFAQG